jgi:hypothetical protein
MTDKDQSNEEDIDTTKLDPELLKMFENIDNIDLDKVKTLYNQDIDQSIYGYDEPNKTKKLIQSPHEIIFTITAKVIEENLKGEISGEKEICIKNYHIPVPIDKNYKNYMQTFFGYLEENILSGIEHANQESEET